MAAPLVIASTLFADTGPIAFEQKLTLPIGVMATIDGDAETLAIDEAKVA